MHFLEDEKKVLYLIATRLLEATSAPYLYTTQKVVFDCGGTEFTANGKLVRDSGWKVYEEALRNYYKISSKNDSNTDDNT